jgi:hypothetical protein
MNNVIDTLQKARLLESFCGHDLRGEVGRCISFLGLLQDQLPEGASAEFREMIELSAKSARDAPGHYRRREMRFSSRPSFHGRKGFLQEPSLEFAFFRVSENANGLGPDFFAEFIDRDAGTGIFQ